MKKEANRHQQIVLIVLLLSFTILFSFAGNIFNIQETTVTGRAVNIVGKG